MQPKARMALSAGTGQSSPSLFARCRNWLLPTDWMLARFCVNQKGVKLYPGGENDVEALVAFDHFKPNHVRLDWSEVEATGCLRVHCSCHLAGRCSHVCAAILALDAQGGAVRVPGKFALELRTISPLPLKAGKESAAPAPPPVWARELKSLAARVTPREIPSRRPVAPNKKVYYEIDAAQSQRSGKLNINLMVGKPPKHEGDPFSVRPLNVSYGDVPNLPDPVDRQLLGLLLASRGDRGGYYSDYYDEVETKSSQFVIRPALYSLVGPLFNQSDRCVLASKDRTIQRMHWDDGPGFQFRLMLRRGADGQPWRLAGELYREDETIPIDHRLCPLDDGLILLLDRVAPLADKTSARWILSLLRSNALEAPDSQVADMVAGLWNLPNLPEVVLPAELAWTQSRPEPQPRLLISNGSSADGAYLDCRLQFAYEGTVVAWKAEKSSLVDAPQRRVVHRNRQAERAAWEALLEAGMKPSQDSWHDHDGRLRRKSFSKVVNDLNRAGWRIEAEGKLFRQAGKFKMSVSSGADWFELNGQVDYEGQSVALPQLLAAARRGDQYVTLDDGSQGLLPEDWLARYAPMAEMATAHGDTLRFANCQALLLDAWLAAQPQVDVDASFEVVRQRLRAFDGVQPSDAPADFVGRLRDYQREGLGWLHFLREFQFGGCLADDMGLGKTVQVLALLEARRVQRAGQSGESDAPAGPALVVAPRSLVYNWIEEARRFTPQLRVLDYTGLARSEAQSRFHEYDLVITTYGTLRRDIGTLKDVVFDYAILDEAQAIKNHESQSAKACRLLTARQRLAMTGTPVENHLGELWSLFEFLNPGLLGRAQVFDRLTARASRDVSGLEMVARALRPLMLRRTKEQVLSELPEKTEQTLYCELRPQQRKLYDELRDHYRSLLMQKIEAQGLKRSKIQVLEALLRLRQAACHPALLDKQNASHASAKLETLLEQLNEVLEGGHKALVFSQFTSLLSLVKAQLDERKITYEYLDGRTRDRQARVERFQQDPACPVFLISLKAGGQGLNLTAADYVFILDPWWNPAVEAQAVDRAHRIGQERPVFAYRLIARDTVEEKILELQQTKRKLADAIVSADNSLLSTLSAEDLQLLLS